MKRFHESKINLIYMLFIRNSFISKVHIDNRGKNKILYSMQIIHWKEGK